MTYKFGQLEQGQETPWYYLDLYWREPTTGPERLVIAPTHHHVHWLRRLSEGWAGGYFILYVLLQPRTGSLAGRYQSPPLDRAGLEEFLESFGSFLQGDGRHNVWVGSLHEEGTLVYDQHNVIYAYGPLDAYEQVLASEGLHKAPVEVPAPHVHRYHPSFDADEARLMARWAWLRSDLTEDEA
jgi:hypothetical protein